MFNILVNRVFGVDAADFHLKGNLRVDYELDSLDLNRLLMEVECDFDIELEDKDIEDIFNVESVLKIISEKLK